MKIRSLICLTACSIILLGIPTRSSAQLEAYGNIVPPSPRSTEFEKFVNYKVSLSNGLPDIGINFYTMEVDNVKIPIGISYHASGIKFGQSNGDVGLGWGLSTVYRVSRTVYGRVDEVYSMPDMNNMPGNVAIRTYLNNNFSTPYDRDKYLARYINPRDQAFVTALQGDYLDGQFDIFTLGLPSQSGNFIISDRTNKVVSMLNNSALKLSYTTGAIGIDGFNITDMEGVKYRMGQNDANSENLQVSIGGVLSKYSTAWMISDITTPLNNVISFQYQPFQETRGGIMSYSRTFKEGAYNTATHQCFDPTDVSQETLGNSSVYNTNLLSVINGVNETAIFNRNTNGTISDIQIRKKNNDLLKDITFYYSQFGSRVFLDSVKVAGSDGVSKERYKFDYESKNISYNYYDNFNYYQSSGLSGYAPAINGLYYYQVPCSHLFPTPWSISGSNRESYTTTNIYMLKKITYPTGGSVNYAYEPNRYKADGDLTATNGGGMRVWSITSDDGSGNPILQHTYIYGNDSDGSGKMLFNVNDPKLLVKESIVPFLSGNTIPGPVPLMLTRRRTINTSVDGDLADGYVKDNMGWYSKVRELYNGGSVDYFFDMPYYSTDIQPFTLNSSYNYSNMTQLSVTSPSYYVKGYHFWNKPMLSEQDTYNGNGVIKRKEVFSYQVPGTDNPNNQFVGLKVSTFAVATGAPFIDLNTLPNVYQELGINSMFNYDTYTITSGDVLLKSKTVSDYDNTGNEIKVTSNYDYTTGNLISEEKMSTSTGELLTTKFKYSSNFTGITASDSFSAGVKNLQTKNIISPVIEKSIFKSNADGTGSRLINSTLTTYKPTLPLADKIFEVESPLPVLGFTPLGVQAGTLTKDAAYNEKLSIDSYNAKGKVQSLSKPASAKVCYLWGYNGQYPVAKVIGSDYNTISGIVNMSILDNPSSDQQLRNELNNLRANLPDAQVTTYTYAPLVGMTSETDPKGQTIYYEYDSFQRLKNVKDQNGHIIKSTTYQYKP